MVAKLTKDLGGLLYLRAFILLHNQMSKNAGLWQH